MLATRFTILWRAEHLRVCNEAEPGSLALRLTSSPQQGFASEDGSHPRLPGWFSNGQPTR
jgi:hypothetical protein